MIELNINGQLHRLDIEPEMPLLWALRNERGLTGTKYGCGIAACGACTVHINGQAVRSCVMPVSAATGAAISTIEGLAHNAAGTDLDPIQQAWVEHQVPQCGYCQSGMIMAVSALLQDNPDPDEAAISASLSNVCRCGTYPRVSKALRDLIAARRNIPDASPAGTFAEETV
jgi:isoquinoline 1-oxidoreductase subunit alpha